MARVLNLYFYFQIVKSVCPFVSDGRIDCNSNLSNFGKSETILTGNLMQKCIYTIDQGLLCACHVYTYNILYFCTVYKYSNKGLHQILIAIHKVQMHAVQYEIYCMVCSSVWAIMHSLKLVDYLPMQTHK